jgi:hypothetical protein
MALTFSLVAMWDDGKREHVSGTIVASGAYPSAITADTITFYGIIKKHQ